MGSDFGESLNPNLHILSISLFSAVMLQAEKANLLTVIIYIF